MIDGITEALPSRKIDEETLKSLIIKLVLIKVRQYISQTSMTKNIIELHKN